MQLLTKNHIEKENEYILNKYFCCDIQHKKGGSERRLEGIYTCRRMKNARKLLKMHKSETFL